MLVASLPKTTSNRFKFPTPLGEFEFCFRGLIAHVSHAVPVKDRVFFYTASYAKKGDRWIREQEYSLKADNRKAMRLSGPSEYRPSAFGYFNAEVRDAVHMIDDAIDSFLKTNPGVYRQAAIDYLKWLDMTAREIRREHGMYQVEEVIWQGDVKNCNGRRCVVVSNGYDGAHLEVVDGNYPLDYESLYEKFYPSENDALDRAREIVEKGFEAA